MFVRVRNERTGSMFVREWENRQHVRPRMRERAASAPLCRHVEIETEILETYTASLFDVVLVHQLTRK